MPSNLSAEARKIISRWARDEAYVYMRPLTSKWIDPTKKHRVYWKVQVEIRTAPPGRWDAEGYDLNEVILSLGQKVPRRRIPNPGFDPKTKDGGLLAPKKVFKQELEEAKRRREVSERPKKRPKDKQAKRKKKKEK
jgi:hypothetical protein